MVGFGPKIPQIMVSALLGDTYLVPGNAMLRAFQALLQPTALGVNTLSPPGSPSNGDMYVVGIGAGGSWVGADNKIAYWSTDNLSVPLGEWEFFAPLPGWVVGNVNGVYVFNGTIWATFGSENVQTVSASQSIAFGAATNAFFKTLAGTLGISLTLPSAVGNGGRILRFKQMDGLGGATGLITVGGQTIDTLSSFSLTNSSQSVSLESDNANWLIVASAG